MSRELTCVGCGKVSPAADNHEVGWGCLFGSLAVCSVACAAKYGREESRYKCVPAGELGIKFENDKGDEVWMVNSFDIP